nr:ankyrin repeat domain-containing protein [Wolbachia endosymbiont (group A) of Acrocera orbiculus]
MRNAINARDHKGYTPLHIACKTGEGRITKEIIKELVKAGANVEQKDKYGKTPMDYARNNKEIKEVLENVKMANKQREFIERIRVVSESTAAGVIVAKEELETVDEKVL